MPRKYKTENNEICRKAVIFARVSSEKQEKGASIDAQKSTIYDYCDRQNFTIIKEFIITESSSRGDRKQYHEMLKFVLSCSCKIAIVVNCVDRLQRSYKDTPVLDDLRKQGKIEVHFLKENLILSKNSRGMDILFWNMCVLMANSYILALSDNVKRSLEFNWSQGKWQSLAPIGYLNIKGKDGKSQIIIDKERAPIIKKLFEEYATGLHSGVSLLQLARSMGLVSKQPNYHKESANYQKKSFIHVNTILSMLRNPFYYGMMCIKGKLMPHIHGNIISKDLFDRVQEVLDSKHKEGKRQQQLSKHIYIFRSLITCGCCGHKVFSDYSAKRSKYIYLRCYHCKNPSVNENMILQQLEEEVFSKIILSNQEIKHLQDALNKHFEEKRIRNTELKEAILKIVEILGNLSLFMQQSDNKAKNILLSLLLSNCTLKDKKLTYTLNKPFNYLLTTPNHKEWKDIIIKHLKEFKKMVLMIEKM